MESEIKKLKPEMEKKMQWELIKFRKCTEKETKFS